ncbi:bifunctional phosphopantothenoylcysteine decarboxylase/phosphopantothenate--cysteine ligase CoaBC [Sanguibacter antarcticus]|uniref:Coenzyme A biosynthesis bifunctional protein CoaBC n=1 Tax=Sanguibacter antarcticus TaxID=372484 RepID=A0A2A9E2D6_9MICO|nr:bifunctional phosphopantothenoylcysteine decarboxylase/phosphopantothenate--cysteine ligase CoaBC [Sanguibacter antarcticus]PFG33118.1 phosphopantothenoylcysteine decarboxylase/phosphopantothenate--cysteine ligase [Sanguibacter antarcticus]
MRIILGVSGGIAAYKSVLLLRQLTEAGHRVRVVPTEAALRFVGAPTWEALSGEPVTSHVFDDVAHVPHVALGQGADLVVVAPATADLLARMAGGMSDDLLTATLLTARCPVLVAPAMHTEMWTHPATRSNVRLLRERGVHVLEPASGRLTGDDSGQGRLPEPSEIAAAALALVDETTASASEPAVLDRPLDLLGRTVVVSAGGTREPIDPVRFLGNRSTGLQGYALAEVACARGASVVLVAANTSLPDPHGVEVVHVETTEELRAAVRRAAGDADVVIMAAAVADFRPVGAVGHKIKKRSDGVVAPIELVANPDVLAELAAHRLVPGQVVVGFAAETGDEDGDVLEHGRAKARRKGADLLVVNRVGEGRGFAVPDNDVTVLDGDGSTVTAVAGSKAVVAGVVLDCVHGLLAGR